MNLLSSILIAALTQAPDAGTNTAEAVDDAPRCSYVNLDAGIACVRAAITVDGDQTPWGWWVSNDRLISIANQKVVTQAVVQNQSQQLQQNQPPYVLIASAFITGILATIGIIKADPKLVGGK